MSHPPDSPDPAESGDQRDGAAADPWAAPAVGTDPGNQMGERFPYPPQPQHGPTQYQAQFQPQYGQPADPSYPGYPPRTNGKAQGALWAGIGLLVLSCCGLGLFGVVPVILGVQARRQIRASGGEQAGAGIALAGIITGAIALVLSLVVIALFILVGLVSGSPTFHTTTSTGV